MNHPELRMQSRPRLADVSDVSSRGNYRFVCVPEPGTGPDEIIEQLRLVYGVQTRVPVLLPKPLPRMIRSWVRALRDEDLLGSLAILEEAIAGQAVPSQSIWSLIGTAWRRCI